MADGNAVSGERSVSIGRIIGRAFGVMGHNPLVAFGIAFLFGALPGLIGNYLIRGIRPEPGDARLGMIGIGIVSIVVAVILQTLVQGALVRATLAESDGRKAGFGECVGAAINRIVPLIVVAILFGLGVAFGMMLLVVPGIILLIMWSVATPAVVAEGAGIGAAFRRSRQLTKGARWKILGLFLLLLVIILLLSAIVGIVVVAAGGIEAAANPINPLILIMNAVVNTIALTVGATIQTSLYVELREWKDGPGIQALGDIFG